MSFEELIQRNIHNLHVFIVNLEKELSQLKDAQELLEQQPERPTETLEQLRRQQETIMNIIDHLKIIMDSINKLKPLVPLL